MKVSINLNELVKIKLTDYGKDIFFHKYDAINKEFLKNGLRPIDPIMPDEDEHGYTTMQLWHVMETFGPHLWNGCKQIIDKNEIILEKSV